MNLNNPIESQPAEITQIVLVQTLRDPGPISTDNQGSANFPLRSAAISIDLARFSAAGDCFERRLSYTILTVMHELREVPTKRPGNPELELSCAQRPFFGLLIVSKGELSQMRTVARQLVCR